MRAVIQRVLNARLSVAGKSVSEIGKGLVVYLGVGKDDDDAVCEFFARKIANMRIFDDKAGKMNLSVLSENYEVLLVSQFTLYGDASRGNRPGFSDAQLPEIAEKLYGSTADYLRMAGVSVKTGVFGADMTIDQVNAGPVTIILER